ncbi:MAG: hypothetical protein Q8L88_06470 [Bacteroidota bacterium]|nr:hypothetical protein [Bacteroidota bacterium]
MKFICRLTVILCLVGTAAEAQSFVIGSKDYGLASSSVMWMPRASALFLNPSEVGRIHQNEFLVSTNRFRTLASMSGAYSIPFWGTVAAGIANQDSLSNYTVGYGRRLWNYHTIGTSVSVISKVQDGFRFAFGSAFHFPFSVQNSGLHVGMSVANLPKETMLNGGIAIWAIPDWVRIQAAAQNRTYRAMVYGSEILLSDQLSFVAGTRAFKSVYGGMNIRSTAFSTEVALGPGELCFSLNIVIGESAEEHRSVAYEEGYNLFSEKRYSEAYQKFRLAIEFDEFDDDSREMTVQSQNILDSVETTNLQAAKKFEEKSDFASAIASYSTVIRANPSNATVESQLAATKKRMTEYVNHLIAAGDSLMEQREIARARKNYELALKNDPGNEAASSRIDDLENLSKENVKTILKRARSLLNKKQFDNAQKEFERALTVEPKNSQAKAGLNAIKTGRLDDQFEIAKEEMAEGRYFEALLMMLDLSKQNIKNKNLPGAIELARAKLQPEVEKQFKRGLALYANENYQEAINIWDNTLLIQPRHTGILEYRKRAEEKMKALEQLK